jgi:hypothetical protein
MILLTMELQTSELELEGREAARMSVSNSHGFTVLPGVDSLVLVGMVAVGKGGGPRLSLILWVLGVSDTATTTYTLLVV